MIRRLYHGSTGKLKYIYTRNPLNWTTDTKILNLEIVYLGTDQRPMSPDETEIIWTGSYLFFFNREMLLKIGKDDGFGRLCVITA